MSDLQSLVAFFPYGLAIFIQAYSVTNLGRWLVKILSKAVYAVLPSSYYYYALDDAKKYSLFLGTSEMNGVTQGFLCKVYCTITTTYYQHRLLVLVTLLL